MPSSSKEKNSSASKKYFKKFYAINKNSCVLITRQKCGNPSSKKSQVSGFSIISHFPDETSRHLVPSSKKVTIPFFFCEDLIKALQRIKPKNIEPAPSKPYFGDYKYPYGSYVYLPGSDKAIITKHKKEVSLPNFHK